MCTISAAHCIRTYGQRVHKVFLSSQRRAYTPHWHAKKGSERRRWRRLRNGIILHSQPEKAGRSLSLCVCVCVCVRIMLDALKNSTCLHRYVYLSNLDLIGTFSLVPVVWFQPTLNSRIDPYSSSLLHYKNALLSHNYVFIQHTHALGPYTKQLLVWYITHAT